MMKNAKASKLELGSAPRRGDSQIVCRTQPSARSAAVPAPIPAPLATPISAAISAAVSGRLPAPRSAPRSSPRPIEAPAAELGSQRSREGAAPELAAAIERYSELFDSAPTPSVQLGVDGRVRELNRAASQLLGVTGAALPGRHFRLLVAADDRARFDAFIDERRATDAPASLELSLLRAGAGRFDARLLATGLSGHEPSILLAFEDVSERNARDAALAAAQQALREADRRKDDFLALLCHELRNPLTPLSNCLFVLSCCEPSTERARAARSIMQRQVQQLTRLTEDLLDVTRIARGKMRLSRERVDWSERLAHTLEDHRVSFDGCGVSLETQIDPGPCWVRADAARLTQAMSNLLGNALKFTPRGGCVAVSLSRERGRVALRIRDTGAGIAPEVLPWVFEPFAQAPQTLDRSQGGLGLGLTVVKALVELHGGSVSAFSAGAGLGTEFVVWLPLDTRGG